MCKLNKIRIIRSDWFDLKCGSKNLIILFNCAVIQHNICIVQPYGLSRPSECCVALTHGHDELICRALSQSEQSIETTDQSEAWNTTTWHRPLRIFTSWAGVTTQLLEVSNISVKQFNSPTVIIVQTCTSVGEKWHKNYLAKLINLI